MIYYLRYKIIVSIPLYCYSFPVYILSINHGKSFRNLIRKNPTNFLKMSPVIIFQVTELSSVPS